ncbi:MAG: GNAT family N-acetyltransferase [Anaerolineae bacterium]|nr:GNAT family N-acetyltransferase [Anaerolineae bacterium]
MRVELHRDPAAFDTLCEEWDALLARSAFDTLFLRPAWLGTWWQVFGREGALRIVTVRDGRGNLVGVAPLFLAPLMADARQPVPDLSYERPVPQPSATPHETLLFVGGTEVTDYLDFIVERTQAPEVYKALFAAVLEEGGWEWTDLHCLPDFSPTVATFGALARAAGLEVQVAQEDVCPFVTLPRTWPEYLAMLGGKERHELRRKMARAARTTRVEVLEAGDPAALEDHLQAFIALHEASTPDKADFMRDPRMRRFFDLVARMALENGWLDLSFLALDGRLAASIFCFRYGDAVLVYNSGFEPRAWQTLSPGIVLFGHRIRKAIEEGRREFDFMQGNERYKYDLGGRDRPIYRLFIRRP